jgi:uncharacterized protein YndB with AHSA1/START domain
MIRESDSGPLELASVSSEVKDGHTVVVFNRDFAFAPDRVWPMLTEPAQLRSWAPHTADRDLSSVGRVVFTMLGDADGSTPSFDVPGAVLVAHPPVELEHSWATDVLAWSLAATANGCTLTLRHTLSDADMASAVAAGWHLCLDVADAALAGQPTEPVRGMEALKRGWSDLNEGYAAALGVKPTHLPGA